MEILIFLLVSYVLFSISMMKLFEKAGEASWKALVPGLNFVVMCKLVGRSPAHALWLLVPIVNIFIFVGLCIDLARSFGYLKLRYSALAVIYAPALFFYIGNKGDKYLGPTLKLEREYSEKIKSAIEAGKEREAQKLIRQSPYHKSAVREWVEAITFAVFAAAFIRMFLIEAYTIPTSSMEGTLKVGDFLFVSKVHYGIRTPQTVLMVPLLHNRIPGLNVESYIAEPSLPYYRLPGLQQVERYDPVVFNYPEGDSVYVFPERTYSIYDFRRGAMDPRRYMQVKAGNVKLIVRPVDKKDHYIKRCIGLPGDSLQVIDRQVYINGVAARNPTHMQFRYLVKAASGSLNLKQLDEWGVNLSPTEANPAAGVFHLDSLQVEKIKSLGNVTVEVMAQNAPAPNIFPHEEKKYLWSMDNFGPIYIPKKGATVKLDMESLPFYRRIIAVYEGNDLQVKEGKIFINGQEADTYTFKMNYYWMMGDNRHNSEDSRVWGFVPEDHIVGKPLFIWFSTKNGNMANGINWDRIFKSASEM